MRLNKVDRIACDLAVELSERGVSDWRRFIPLARQLRHDLDRQLLAWTTIAAGIGTVAGAARGETQ
jgi:hypothetical protein